MTLSTTAKTQVFNQEGGGFLTLLTISHSSMTSPIRVVANTVNITSNGNVYVAYPFQLTLPEDSEATPPRARLVIDNVTRELSEILREIVDPLLVDIEIVRLDSLDTVEVSLPSFKLRNVEIDVLTISGELTIDDVTNEPFPARSITPSEYPGLF